jgi:hypothetical protein
MRAAAGSKRVLVTMPPQVRQWLEQTALYNGSTLSGEAVRAIRERMEREDEHRLASKADATAAEWRP